MLLAPRVASLLLVASFIAAAACSSGTTSATGPSGDGGTSSVEGGGSAGCGLAFTGPKWSATCQAWSDQYCCDQQKACAANAACAALIACIDACPAPRKDPCINACTPDGGPAIDLLDAFGTCSKATPPGGAAIPTTCEWPTGG